MENCTKRIKIPLSANYYLLDKLIFKWINKDKDHKRIIKRLYKKFKTTNNMKKKKRKKKPLTIMKHMKKNKNTLMSVMIDYYFNTKNNCINIYQLVVV